jgi:hypothetical protein
MRMMINHQTLLDKLDAYLNRSLALAELVDWAESALIEPEIPDDQDADAIMDILMYLGAADTRGFPLTWEVLSEFMQKLGGNVRVIVEHP